MAGSERAISNSATADARAADRTAGKPQTAAASKAPSTHSDMPTEATAFATWTGFRSVVAVFRPAPMSRTLKWRMSSPPSSIVSQLSLSVHCDKRKEKDRLFVGAGRSRVLYGRP